MNGWQFILIFLFIVVCWHYCTGGSPVQPAYHWELCKLDSYRMTTIINLSYTVVYEHVIKTHYRSVHEDIQIIKKTGDD